MLFPSGGAMITGSFAGLSAIGQIAVGVKSLDRAVEFYRDRLGVRLLFQAPPGLAFFDAGGVRLMLSVPEPGAGAGSSVLYFKVDQIDGVQQTLASLGVEFTGPPHLIARMPDHELWMTFFRDSEENL